MQQTIDTATVASLLKAVDSAPDIEIWNTIYDLASQSTLQEMAGVLDPEIIKSRPIGNGLATFHDVLRSACVDLSVPASADGVEQLVDKGDTR